MGDLKALRNYEKAVQAGAYEPSPLALRRKSDPVRLFWEDQITRGALSGFLLPLLEREKKASSTMRVLDLGCGSGGGIVVLTDLRRVRAEFTLSEPETLFPDGLDYYRGVDLSPGMIRKAREQYDSNPGWRFDVADLQDGLPVSEGEPPYDIYFSSYGSLSHLPDPAFRALLGGICDHMGTRAIFVADLLGRYSYEWPRYWNDAGEQAPMQLYSMDYVYSNGLPVRKEFEEFPMRYWGGEEFDRFLEETVTAKGVRVVRRETRDRSVLVGRHMDTRQYNPSAPPIRSAVNSLHTPNQRTDLSGLLFDYRQQPGSPRLNRYFKHFQSTWNGVVTACARGVARDRAADAELEIASQDLPDLARTVIQTLHHALREARGFRMGDPVANLIEPQLGYLLRDLEQGLQRGWGAAHGLLGLYELRKDGPAR